MRWRRRASRGRRVVGGSVVDVRGCVGLEGEVGWGGVVLLIGGLGLAGWDCCGEVAMRSFPFARAPWFAEVSA